MTHIRPTRACGLAGGRPRRQASRRRRWGRVWWPLQRTWRPQPSRLPSPSRPPTRLPPQPPLPPPTRLSLRASSSATPLPPPPRISCTTASTCLTPIPPSPPVLVSVSLFSDHFLPRLLIGRTLKTKQRWRMKKSRNNLEPADRLHCFSGKRFPTLASYKIPHVMLPRPNRPLFPCQIFPQKVQSNKICLKLLKQVANSGLGTGALTSCPPRPSRD